MARTIEQIRAEKKALEDEERELMAGHIKALKLKAVDVLTELHELGALPKSMKDAVEAKDGTINLRRTFAIRG